MNIKPQSRAPIFTTRRTTQRAALPPLCRAFALHGMPGDSRHA